MYRADRIANRLHEMWKGTIEGQVRVPTKTIPHALEDLSAA
jgi:hypothetical protein